MKAETLVQRHLDRWAYLLGLGKWRITWDIADGLGHDNSATIEYTKKRGGYQTAHIRFDRLQMTSPAKIESAVVHELLHLFDHGIGNDAHKLIYKLERPLRLVRKRLTK